MGSPTLADEQLAEKYGRRDLPKGAVPFDQPQELGYVCPKGHKGDYLTWSEFNEHIWCYKCENDYHYAEDCKLKRICWMDDKQWSDFLGSLPAKPKVIRGIQHFPDCEIPHKEKSIGAMK